MTPAQPTRRQNNAKKVNSETSGKQTNTGIQHNRTNGQSKAQTEFYTQQMDFRHKTGEWQRNEQTDEPAKCKHKPKHNSAKERHG